ncbi:2-succinyl-5-enolpyruvyl-6-hydroxy-3-cyclohexene-1-carboxylic-acid synthase [Raoultibacter phocaeensis]|uniref:2-succinyl-5-enolpyruvyl-6-hydroxy-3- cyclohexene-1-carboxylic-acid synthase n=1 Tax=Raoultibacter phocaeensis TaxID=2479841 RepID=UPI00111B694A|nr:2-succinyl-5-enolpyruvyl-6-hydroxy-3-cyclohexene-1-carboxylic-acid synthase [Raoultibacter phocaeensis]
MPDCTDTPRASALFLSAFFDELACAGVRDVVVSSGSRSTPLAMVAHESSLNLYVDIDERGAAFFALGLAKASGRPVCIICTSGTAVANYYPAVLEAESSRVPLIVLSGDRPPRLQNLGAPQTCDQLKAYGDHVRHFQQMPLPSAEPRDIAFARQMAKTAFFKAAGFPAQKRDGGEPFYGCAGNAGPVHVNFPFDEPLKPDLSVSGLFTVGRTRAKIGDRGMVAETSLADDQTERIIATIEGKRTVALVGEGTCFSRADAQALLDWAHRFSIPLLADPLSGMRSLDDTLVIDAYDSIFAHGEQPRIECVIRFGRYPVSKSCFSSVCSGAATQGVQKASAANADASGVSESSVAPDVRDLPDGGERPVQIVVDAVETRDFNAATDLFVRCDPLAFVNAMRRAARDVLVDDVREASARAWEACNDAARVRTERALAAHPSDEAAVVAKALELAPDGSLVFAANSMSVRLIDAVYLKSNKRLTVLCNRGLNGIDGTVSSALGAAQLFAQTTFITGDLTMLHDLNALALQRELIEHHGGSDAPSIVIVLLNNRGGGIFDTLPQKSEEPYFERLFLTPHSVDFAQATQAFGVPHALASTTDEFELAYETMRGTPGITLIEVPFALDGFRERFGRCR